MSDVKPIETDVLLVVDVQNDFCPGGALAVPAGDQVLPVVNRLIDRFEAVVLTQDWHPAGHASFASSHPGKQPYGLIEMSYGDQVLWPDHCVQDTAGAAFHPDLRTGPAAMVVRKGFRREIDSYSAFFENDHTTVTGLKGYLHDRGLSRLFVVGLALDFCVRYSAEDAARLGFETFVIEDGCRAIDLDGSLAAAHQAFEQAGVSVVQSTAIAA